MPIAEARHVPSGPRRGRGWIDPPSRIARLFSRVRLSRGCTLISAPRANLDSLLFIFLCFCFFYFYVCRVYILLPCAFWKRDDSSTSARRCSTLSRCTRIIRSHLSTLEPLRSLLFLSLPFTLGRKKVEHVRVCGYDLTSMGFTRTRADREKVTRAVGRWMRAACP